MTLLLSPFTDEEMETQRNYVNCPEARSYQVLPWVIQPHYFKGLK